jgi:hypothetical protein
LRYLPVLWISRWLYLPLSNREVVDVEDRGKRHELQQAQLKLENDARTTMLQGLGALLVLTGAGLGVRATLEHAISL